MELKKTVFLLLAASFTLLASSDSFVTSNELDKSFKMSTSSELQPSSSNLRRGLKYIDDEEERGINIIGGIQASISERKTRRAVAQNNRLHEIKRAMLNGKLSQFTNSEFAKYFVAGQYVDDVVKILRTAGKSEAEIATFTKNYKAWIKEIKKVNLKRIDAR
ncbi:hypothetical protein P3T76_005556 [Phytophthora citrophthora]|uniref:RxLR effector protein n=1 Tax=Phytophthora citrophthora TaxID=4793 RepID=A0AAD9GQW3_9STRA|nr:hypothetical protein P3T76_005556 [Phytophthora citrophthora]